LPVERDRGKSTSEAQTAGCVIGMPITRTLGR